jgi:hypothetical protein
VTNFVAKKRFFLILQSQIQQKSIKMKKTALLLLALAAFVSLQAQWVDNPATNTFISNSSNDAGEIYLSTDEVSGDTYVQWAQMRSNGWAPILQRLDFQGNPQWGNEGIPMTNPDLATWSPGYAMTATNDGGVVSVFRTASAYNFAVRINADGSFPWGEDGIMLFDGNGGDRSEVMAGDDGGVWALATDYDNTYLQYVYADGTLGPVITMGDGEHQYMFGLMVPTIDNSVLVVFEKENWAYTYYYEKEIWVVGYTRDGVQIAPEVQLMSPYTMAGSYCHYVVPDGTGGGYAYMWHAGISGAFNTYVFHFDQYGNSTINDLNGTPVHTADPMNFYLSAYGTVDPKTHDLIIAYEQTDASTQAQSRIYVNRITTTGERLWGEGLLVADYFGDTYSDILVNAFEDGEGFSIIYNKGNYNTTIEAIGFDKDGNQIWTKQMCSSSYSKAMCDNSAGFHLGQNVVAWVNTTTGGVYGQNIGIDGTMGEIPFIPIPTECPGPENFQGEYVYDMDEEIFGVALSWTPVDIPDYYILYRIDATTGEEYAIEIESSATTYFDETGIGRFKYQLRGASEACGLTLPATTPDGEEYVYVEVTSLEENTDGEIVTLQRIFTMSGQSLRHCNTDELSNGLYILQGLTQDGKLVSRKVVVNK